MPQQLSVTMDVRRPSDEISVIDIRGDVTAACEDVLMDAYARASDDRTRAIVLNFSGLEYMNSGGIGLLVTLLVRANRQQQRLLARARKERRGVAACGLSAHYQQIFEIPRLADFLRIVPDEPAALAAGGAIAP